MDGIRLLNEVALALPAPLMKAMTPFGSIVEGAHATPVERVDDTPPVGGT